MKTNPNLPIHRQLIICLILLLSFEQVFPVDIKGKDSKLEDLLEKAANIQSINLDAADSLVTLVLEQAKIKEDLPAKARAFKIFADGKRLRNHNVQAILHYNNALKIYSRLKNSFEIHEIYKWLGLCYAHESEYEKGFELLWSAFNYADSLNLTDSKAQISLNTARLYKSKGDFKHSLKECMKAKQLAGFVTDHELAWKIDNFTGFILFQNNKHKQALELLNQSLSKKNDFKNNTTEIYRLYHYIASIYIFLKEYDKALRNLYASENVCKDMANKELGNYFSGLAHLYIGSIYDKYKEYDSSRYHLLNALNNVEFSKDLHAKGHTYCFLGNLYFNEKKYDSALVYYNTSIEIHMNNKEIDRLNWALLGKAKTYFHTENKEEAKKIFINLLNDKSLNLELKEQASEYLSILFEQKNDYKSAYQYQNINKLANEELINEEKIKEITRLEIEHEFLNKRQELEYEREQERSLYEAKLKQNKLTTYLIGGGFVATLIVSFLLFRNFNQKKKANEEKEVLLKEIHHRVKNNLQVISSILNLQSNYLSDPHIKVALNESQGRVKSMALIHQMLYQQEKFNQINIGDYLFDLCKTISSTHCIVNKKVMLKKQFDPIWFDIDTAVPLGLIANELITNAYKYAFSKQSEGTITLEVRKISTNNYFLKVSDDGIGLPESFTSSHKSRTLGLDMVKILSKQLKGELIIESNEGTTFTCNFSKSNKKNSKHTNRIKNGHSK